MKPSIDEQIEAVAFAHALLRNAPGMPEDHYKNVEAALSTLHWVKRYTKPSLDALMAEFPGARVKQREEE